MSSTHLISFLQSCVEKFPSQASELGAILSAAEEGEDVINRKRFTGHVTASACVLTPTDEVLMIYSPKFDQWLLPGGHVDAGENPAHAALRELREECGITLSPPLPTQLPTGIDIHMVPANERKLEPAHRHIDCQFVFKCDTNDLSLTIDKREVAAVEWKSLIALRDHYAILHQSLTRK